MDAFEQLVSEILWMQGYWVRTSVKVELTKEEKREIGRHSSPRWELDVVGYNARENTLLIVECKSYIDSVGVRASAFDGSSADHAKRYKLFNEPELRRVVFNRLALQFTQIGACRESPIIRMALACGRIRNDVDRAAIHAHFEGMGWELWDEPWLRKHLQRWQTKDMKTKPRLWSPSSCSGGRSNSCNQIDIDKRPSRHLEQQRLHHPRC